MFPLQLKAINKWQINFNLSKLFILSLLILGIFFRCANLGSKIFWVDEVFSAIRIAGYSKQELVKELSDLDVIDRDTILQFQKINSDKNFRDVFAALKQSPEHAPLYFLATRFWGQMWGSSLTAIRSLSVVFSLCIFPCLYWLYWELFRNPTVCYVGLALMSVSPFYVAYAQEARPIVCGQ